MNVIRAREIIQAKEKIEVKYQGASVWIDGVDERTATARVHSQDNPTNSMTVELNQLIEK